MEIRRFWKKRGKSNNSRHPQSECKLMTITKKAVFAEEKVEYDSAEVERDFDVIISDFTLIDASTFQVILKYSMQNPELNSFQTIKNPYDLFCSLSTAFKAPSIPRSCLISGKTHQWGFHFDSYVNKSVVPYEWNTNSALPSEVSFFFSEYAEKNWKIYNRLLPKEASIHEEYCTYVSKKKPIAIGQSFFNNCTINIDAQLSSHKDRGDIKESMTVLTCWSSSKSFGGYLVLPEYKIAVRLEQKGVVLLRSSTTIHAVSSIHNDINSHRITTSLYANQKCLTQNK